jgi:hypothetical protein
MAVSEKILLILSTSRTSEGAVNLAIEKAKESGCELIALYIIETKLTRELFDRFTDIGFIGDKPSTELTEALMKEYRQRGYEEIGKVQIRAMEEGVGFDAITKEGDYIETALQVIEEHSIATAVTVKRTDLGFLSYFKRSLACELSERAECEVIVFKD